jgi:hypothetical protein
MVADDQESVLASTDDPVLFERQVDARHTRIVHALAQKRDGLTTGRRLNGGAQALVSHPEGTLVFGKALLSRVQSNLKYPRPSTAKRFDRTSKIARYDSGRPESG